MADLEVQFARLDERFNGLDKKVDAGFKDLRDNIINRLDRMDTTKLGASDFINYKTEQAEAWRNQEIKDKDFETRIRFIEKYLWAVIGILALAQFIGFAYIINHLNK